MPSFPIICTHHCVRIEEKLLVGVMSILRVLHHGSFRVVVLVFLESSVGMLHASVVGDVLGQRLFAIELIWE